jgi:hypothetical protein
MDLDFRVGFVLCLETLGMMTKMICLIRGLRVGGWFATIPNGLSDTPILSQ